MKIGIDYEPANDEKAEIAAECVENFNAYLNRWPEPRVAEGAVIEWQGEGCLLRDINGREFIDCLGGFGIFALGHRHPKVIRAVKAQMDRLTLRSPVGGIVQKRLVRPGEVVTAGSPILTVANPRDLHMTVYVLEAELGRVNIGQTVAVRSDAFADRVFGGTVQTIATRAEFTPRNVQTQRDRQNLVFAVKVRLPNTDGSLKAGLPADATFEGS